MAEGSGNQNRLYYADLGDPMKPNVAAAVKPVIEADDAEYAPLGNTGPVVYLRTDKDAPNRKVIAVDLQQPGPGAVEDDRARAEGGAGERRRHRRAHRLRSTWWTCRAG